MSETALEQAAQEAPPPAQEQASESKPRDPAVLQRARDLGWVPQDEWKGDPPKHGFLEPEEYIERGENILPIVRSQNRKLESELKATRDELAKQQREHKDTIARIERMTKAALDQQRERIEREYQAKKEAAVEIGDKEAYRQAVKEEREATAAMDERLKEKEPEKKDKPSGDVPPAVASWIDENPWFNSSRSMRALATEYHGELLERKPGLTLEQNLEQVTAFIKKKFPEAFEDEAAEDPPRKGSPVEGGSRIAGGGEKSAWSRIPDDAKRQADRFIKDDKLFLEKGETAEKDLQKARERYAKQYLGE